MKKLFLLLILPFAGNWVLAQSPVAKAKEYRKVYTTYGFSDPNPIPLFTAVYPYFRYDGFTDKPEQRSWKVVELENDYIKLLILPEIGGKIWTALDKTTNKPFLYDNGVIKFRDIAMRGPWTSGGLEANYGIIGHTPNCATPVDYTIQHKSDGSVSCIIGVFELLTRSYWRMEINLPADKAYFTTRSFWYNATPIEQPYYHWMNAGLKAGGNLEFIYPGNKYLGHEGEYANWPVNGAGKKINWYNENNFGGYKSYHVFGKYAEFSGAYWHEDEMGMVRYASKENKAGTKIWIWGLSNQGMIWEKLLTDKTGQYVELQSGRLFNQNAERSSYTPFKHIQFAPYATDTWTEYWYPVGPTKGMVKATDLGALNLSTNKDWLTIRFSPVQAFDDTLDIYDGTRRIYQKAISARPMQLIADSLRLPAGVSHLTARLRQHDFQYDSDPKAGDLGRPVDAPANFNWNSAYGLSVMGREAMAQKNFPQAEEKLVASLKADENYLPSLVLLSELYYRNMRYEEALTLAKKALSIDAHDGGANYFYGLANEALDNLVDAKDGLALATLTMQYRSAAFARLAGIALRENNLPKAVQWSTEALHFNDYNMNAAQILAVAYRLQNNTAAAREQVAAIRALDPLSHFAAIETYLVNPSADNLQALRQIIVNELPQESYMEMAIWYHELGLDKEALAILAITPDCAEKLYWLAYLQHQPVDFSKLDLRLSFPFRSETGWVLEQLRKQQDHWKLRYQLALIYKDRNRIPEAQDLLNSCANEPDYAPFYATRAAICDGKDAAKTIADYEKALSLDNNWRYHKLLAQFYITQQQPEKALPIAAQYYKQHPDNYIMGMLYAKSLLLNKKYAEGDALLQRLNIIPFEGATDGRELYREAKLMQAVEQIGAKNYRKAMQFIAASRLWPENLGVGKPYESDIDYRLENWLTILCNEKTGKAKNNAAIVQQIIAFSPRVDNTVRNFIPANELVTAWAYQKSGDAAKGAAWMEQQARAYPDNKSIAWGKAVYAGEAVPELPTAEKDANTRILEALIAIRP